MRKPKQPGAKTPGNDAPPPGGRAWQRVRQFAIERGLPAGDAESDTAGTGKTKPAAKRITVKATTTRKSGR